MADSITRESIVVEKYFAGLFSSPTTLFTDNKKWSAVNRIIQYINKKDATPTLLPGVPFAEIRISGNNSFLCQIRPDGLSYSVAPDVPFGKFCDDTKRIGGFFKEEFTDTFFNKMGVVFYFRLKVSSPIVYIRNFLKVNIEEELKQSQVHINFRKNQDRVEYNLNINLSANSYNNTMKGSLDVNTVSAVSGNEVMVLNQISTIYQYAEEYFNNEEKFIKLLNTE